MELVHQIAHGVVFGGQIGSVHVQHVRYAVECPSEMVACQEYGQQQGVVPELDVLLSHVQNPCAPLAIGFLPGEEELGVSIHRPSVPDAAG